MCRMKEPSGLGTDPIRRICNELREAAKRLSGVGAEGVCDLVMNRCKRGRHGIEALTLEGLQMIWERNH